MGSVHSWGFRTFGGRMTFRLREFSLGGSTELRQDDG